MSRPITANSTIGRILLALRAGRMTYEVLAARFPSGYHYLAGMERAGHIARADEFYVITAVGLQACPSRRDAPLEPMHGTFWNKSKKSNQNGQGAAA